MPIAAVDIAEAGLLLIRNFDPDEYEAAPQNWAIAQDHQGVIYVGNSEDGVLAFDLDRLDMTILEPDPDYAAPAR